MKEESLALIEGMTDPGQARNRLREYLQAFALRSFHESEAFRAVAFVGGTALRFLHNLPRFSEDLDFSLVSEAGYAGRDWMAKLKRDLLERFGWIGRATGVHNVLVGKLQRAPVVVHD